MNRAQDGAEPSSSDGDRIHRATTAKAAASTDSDGRKRTTPDAAMSKTFVRRSTAACGLVVLLLLFCSVGLLIAFLKGHKQQTLSLGRQKSNRKDGPRPASPSYLPPTTPPSTTTTFTPPTTTREPAKPKYNFRLPDYILPLSYDLTLEPHLDRDTFDGEVWITVNTTRPTNKFFVHVFRLSVEEAEVFDDVGPLETGKPEIDDLNEFLVVPVAAVEGGPVPVGIYRLRFRFRGSLVGGIVGFYKSRYKIGNETRFLATSKFQPTYARRAFPCFDEPSFKSTFNVTLIHDHGYQALSNMRVLPGYPVMRDDRKLVTKFEESVPMVTYLVCFIVSDFKKTETIASMNKIPFSVYATPNQLNKTYYALDIGSRILNFYEEYFGLKYPLPKQDMIAIPDFVSGAMEHWGLITFREVNLLFDAKQSSPRNKQRVAAVVAHELAHMWFGNLVTMKWWDDLWLNEGFASYIEYKGIDHVEPKWDMMDQFLTEDLQPVMDLDSTTTSHPVVQSVSNPDEITEIFDTISYNKGASVLRMLENFLGHAVFRKGVSSFLTHHQFGNARTQELWDELSAAAKWVLPRGYNVSTIMNTWTQQMGYPVVTMTRSMDDPTLITVTQERFLRNTEHCDQDVASSYLWSIPLSYKTSAAKNKVKHAWLHKKKDEFHIYDAGRDGWVKFNVNQTGYYLVNYDMRDWLRLGEVLQKHHEELTPADRSNLLYDAFQLAWSGRLSYDVLFNMTQYLIHEMHLIPWSTAHGSLLALSHLLENTEVRRPMQTYIRKLVDPIYKTLGWEDGEKHNDNLLRTVILDLACRNLHQECLKEAKRRLTAWVDHDQEVPRNIRSIVYRYGMYQSNGDHEWQFMWEKYLKEVSAQERVNLLYGMAHVRSPPLIHRYLTYAMNESYIRRQDFFSVLSFLAGNPVGRDIVWKFVRSKWDKLVHRFSLNDRNLGKTVKTICDYFTKQFDYNEMKAFFTKNPNAGAGKRARKQALENVRNNIAWIMEHEPSVAKWLTSNVIPEPWEGLRLPRHVTPHTYDITLEPILENDTVIGSASINIKLTKATNVILVHARNINIYETRIERASGPNIGKEIRLDNEPFLYAENDFWVTQTKDIMPPGRYMLRFRFESSLLNSLQGLYKSSYTDSRTGEKRNIVTSHLHATAARMVFPCFDEPSFKANFTITVIHSPNMTALSNMPVEMSMNYGETKVATTFQESHKMVTYLVAVVVCDFDHLAGTTSRGTPVRVYARKDMIGYAGYALDTAIQVLEFFEQQFDIPYPLPKLDNIAVPDFQLGAMENWGLITYRESRLLYDPNTSSVSDKFKTAEGVAHELAHMWFGNLVTMKWWDDVWLNEGFATYISSKGVDAVHPAWDMENQFLYKLLSVMEKDAVPSSHPIVLPVSNPNEISEIFDEISYYKGSAVIGMLESFMGSKDFTHGVRNYLRTRKYGSAVTLDLWKELEHASSKDEHITTIMNTWTRQMGFPFVSVKRLDTNSSLYEVSQQRFLLNPEAAANLTNDSPFRYMWEIPVTFKTSTKVQGLHWLRTNASEILDVGVRRSSDWVKFNADFKGYYLVHYEEDDLGMLSEVLFENHKQISPADRAELIFETFLLARAGITPYPVAMELTGYLRKERHFIPLLAASTSLQHIARCLRYDSEEQLFLVYLQYIFEGAFEDFMWLDKGDHLTKRARGVAIELSCFSGDRICRQSAADALMAWVKDEQIAANLRELAYVWGMVHIGNAQIWEHMWQKYLQEPSAGERNKLLRGLASIKNTAIIERLLNASLNESLIRKQDFYSLMSHIAENTQGLHSVWNFLRKHWDLLVERFTLEDRKFGGIVYSVCKHFTTHQRLLEMEEFFEVHPEAGAGTRARSQALAAVKDNIRWLANFREPVLNWIREYKVQPWENLRLPSHVVPIHYDLQLQPFMEDQYFEGKVDIEIQLLKPVRSIHVHIKDMNVTSASITAASKVIPIQEYFEYEDNEFFVMKFDSTMDIGKYALHYEFNGNMTKDLKGLYLSTYTDAQNQTRYLATTQFEPTDARSAFPCFDEPRFKATFSISLIHEPKFIAISNMPVKENSTTATGFHVTKFEKTVAMTTYLVAVVVCDFAHIKGISTNGVEVRVFARKDEIAKAEYAMASALKILSYFEEYFKIKYPLPKLDMIAIPDFSSGAMENWGLITYRETRLLYDPKTSSSTDKQGVCRVIAHEIAHMWFGNLVTMRWWDDLWLNEGFASYIQYKGMDHAEPDWESMTQYVSSALLMVFESDSVVTSHSIVQPVENPNEISSLFDTISYNKGAAVLRMLESFLSLEEFQEGIAKYLRKYQYKNTLTVDLWDELDALSSAKVPISSTMDTWTRQMGYPVLSIKRDGSNFTVEQSWFLMDRDTAVNRTVSRFKYIWHVPLSYRTSTGHTGFVWLKKRKQTLNIDVPKDGWIKFNNNMTGVYFINYDDENFKVILNALKQNINAFTPSDRAELIIESFFLARAGYVKYNTAIELGLYIVKERHLVPWEAFEDVITFMYNRLRGTAGTGELLKRYALMLLKDVLSDLSFEDTGTHMERRLRTTLFRLACKFGHDHCLTSSTNALLEWLSGKPVEPNFKNIVYGYGMRHIGNETIWQRLFDSYMAEPIQAERIKMMTALGQVQDEALIQRYLNFSFDESKVRGQDITMVFSTVANNPKGLEIAWAFLRKNWKDIVDKFTANSRIPGKLIKIVCRNFNSAQKKQEMEEFFAEHPDAGTSKHPREESLQSVQNNIKWISKYESGVATALQAVLRGNE